MWRRGLHAIVLCAFLAQLLLPAFHHHEEGGHGGHARTGAAVERAKAQCVVCELLAVKAQGLAPAPPQPMARALPATVERAVESVAAPACASFWIPCGPRGPPASSPA